MRCVAVLPDGAVAGGSSRHSTKSTRALPASLETIGSLPTRPLQAYPSCLACRGARRRSRLSERRACVLRRLRCSLRSSLGTRKPISRRSCWRRSLKHLHGHQPHSFRLVVSHLHNVQREKQRPTLPTANVLTTTSAHLQPSDLQPLKWSGVRAVSVSVLTGICLSRLAS
jgi:hypothetical protein